MQIKTSPNSNDWIVLAEWLGEVRTVFTGTVFECLSFVNSI